MVNVLVTGGAGFIGSNFVRWAIGAHADWHITNLDKLTYAGRLENLSALAGHPRHTFIKGDIADSTVSAPLFAQTVVEHAPALCDPAALRVDYDEQTFQRLLDRTLRPSRGARPLNAIVKSGTSIRGWYIAAIGTDGGAEVASIAATAATMPDVLRHLFYHAWREGAVSVTGRVEPRFMQQLSDTYCLFHRRGPWVLIKSNTPELVHALESGRTCLSRFDGEWSLRFRPQHD
jgi:NAD(P)-dependent dehydrogenase (short-subunit alcohol dehydrogenase family)